MLVAYKLGAYALRQVIGEAAEHVLGDAVEYVTAAAGRHFSDHSQALPRALAEANDRAWRTLAIALAGDGFCDTVKRLFASRDDKSFREQVARFLNSGQLGLEGTPVQFRQDCLDELQALRKSGLLSAERLDIRRVVEQTGRFARYSDGPGLVAGAWEAVHSTAEALAEGYPNLARLLRQPATGEPPLLAAAFAYFFRRAVETSPELERGLTWTTLRQLSAAQEAAFADIEQALAVLGGRFDEVLEGLGRIEQVAVATHGAVLDLHVELQRLGGMHLAGADELRRLMQEALARLGRLGMQSGEVRPQHSFSIRGEAERAAIKLLLARFRQLPVEQQRQMPALLNGLGKLQVGAGEFAAARLTFAEVARTAGEDGARAEACNNAYRAALEDHKWDEALTTVQQAATLDRSRFAPFPLHRYRPRRILGAGGFGTAFLCHDDHFGRDVVVKALHDGELERGAKEIFREAVLLREVAHPAIIGVLDCDYADPARAARPYIVMDYFPGDSLEVFVRERGPLAPPHLLAVAWQIAEGMQAAHAQGIFHRDLKPDNVLVRKEGNLWQVKVIDFGLALRAQAIETSISRKSGEDSILGSSVAGTIRYASPEQMGRQIDGNGKRVPVGSYSDVYAFGKLCCYALFKTTEPRDRHWSTSPEHLALKPLLEQCIDEDLEHRLHSFQPLVEVLTSLDQRWKQEASRSAVVCPLGNGTHRTIGEALDQAPAGAEIRIRPGLYRECITLDKPVTLLGDGSRHEITVECNSGPVLSMRAEEAQVRGLTLRCTQSSQDEEHGAIDISHGRLVLEECDISSTTEACIAVHGSSTDPLIRRCIIHNGSSSGIKVYDQAGAKLDQCDLFAHSEAAIRVTTGGDPRVTNCKIHDCERRGVSVEEEGRGTFEDCDIFGNEDAAFEVTEGGDPQVLNCRIHDNKDAGVRVEDKGRGTFDGCDIFGNEGTALEVNKGGDPKVINSKIRDNQMWGVSFDEQGSGMFDDCDIFGNEETAIHVSGGGDPKFRNCKIHDNKAAGVWVGEQGRGTFEVCDFFSNEEAAFLVHSGGDPRVLNCRIHDHKDHCILVAHKGRGTFDGCDIFEYGKTAFLIGAGDPNVVNCQIHNGGQGGVYVKKQGCGTFEGCDLFGHEGPAFVVTEGSDPKVINCKIHDNKSNGAFIDDQSRGSFEGCDFFGHKDPAFVVAEGGDPNVLDCKIHNNEGNGVLVAGQGRGTFQKCDLFGHEGPAFVVTEGGDPTVTNCTFHDNEASGIQIKNHGRGTFEGCELFGHEKPAFVAVSGADPKVMNCRIRDNKSNGVLIFEQGGGTFEGCVLFGHEKPAFVVTEGGNPKVINCGIYSNKEGILVDDQGRGAFEGCDLFKNETVAFLVRTGGDPIVINCKIHDNRRLGVAIDEQGRGTFEGCDLFGHVFTALVSSAGGEPKIVRCKIHDNEGIAASIEDQGCGNFDACEFFGNTKAAIAVVSKGDAKLRDCVIRDNKGLTTAFVGDQGHGSFENCQIHGNAGAGVFVKSAGNVTIQKCRINRNEDVGVRASENGCATVTDSDLTNNRGGAWDIEKGCQLEARNNQDGDSGGAIPSSTLPAEERSRSQSTTPRTKPRSKRRTCNDCGGSGKCANCEGQGKWKKGGGWFDKILEFDFSGSDEVTCGICDGKGRCPACKGRGSRGGY